MNVTNYTYLINKPDAISEKQTEALGSVLNEFPYFQSARALRLKGLFIQNSFKYNYALKVTAAHTTDRSVLFDFITSEEFNTIQGEYYDRKLQDLLNITVFDSEIVSVEEKKKTEEIRVDPIEKSILDSIKEATTVVFERPSKIEETQIKTAITEQLQTPVINKEVNLKELPEVKQPPVIKTPTPTFFDEIVEDEDEEFIPKKVTPEIKPESFELPVKVITEIAIEETPQNIAVEIPNEIEASETLIRNEDYLENEQFQNFIINEKHSFQEWLQIARPQPIDRSEDFLLEEQNTNAISEQAVKENSIAEEKKKKAEIIDRFIEANPKISPIRQTAINPTIQIDIEKEDNSYLMTETLARVYLEQKKYTKAIQAYEILILKYPEKITFFADRISDIKILQQNNNNNN